MTLRARNRLLSFSNFTLILISAAVIASVFPRLGSLSDLSELRPARLYGFSFSYGTYGGLSLIVASVVASIIVVGGTSLLRRFFRKSISSALFFVGVSLLFHGATIVRLLHVPLSLLGGGQTFAILLTRFTLFFHYTSVLAFFAASSYAAGVGNPRLWSVLGLVIVTALALAYAVPLDAGNLTAAFLHAYQSTVNLQILTAVIGVLSVANYVRYALENNEVAGSQLVSASVAITVGRELSVHLPGAIPQGVGSVLLLLGIVWFIRSSYSVYLWG